MNKDIKKRIASSEWDMEIATAVIRHRKRFHRKMMMAGIAASIVIAVTAFVIPVIRTPAPSGESGFIAEQVSGVYFKAYEYKAGGDPVDDTIDSIILQ